MASRNHTMNVKKMQHTKTQKIKQNDKDERKEKSLIMCCAF
jgi:hypothetical protein